MKATSAESIQKGRLKIGILGKNSSSLDTIGGYFDGTAYLPSIIELKRDLAVPRKELESDEVEMVLFDSSNKKASGKTTRPDWKTYRFMVDLRHVFPQLKIIVLSEPTEDECVVRFFEAGAVACLIKPFVPAQLVAAIDEVRKYGVSLNASVSRMIVEDLQQSRGRLDVLTPDEVEFLRLLSKGWKRTQLAKWLNRPTSDAALFLQKILEKLGVRTEREAVARFFKR